MTQPTLFDQLPELTRFLPKQLYRRSDPATSKQAAESVKEFKESHEQRILKALEQGKAGKTIINQRTGLDGVAIARRLPELQKRGLIELTGETVKSNTGHKEREWRLNQ